MDLINLLKFSNLNKHMSSFFDFVSEIATNLSTITKIILVSSLVLIFILPGINSIPPLDRDEARFSQASKQMLEDKNYVVIKFQEELRSKSMGKFWSKRRRRRNF